MTKTIALNEFPDTIYVSLEGSDHKKLWEQLLQKHTVKQVAQKLKIPIRNLYKYKEGESGYPLRVLMKLLKEVKREINTVTIKTQRDSKPIEIKLPIVLGEDFAEFLGYLFGDGGIDHQWGVHFTTNDKEVLHRFDTLVKNVFGSVEKQVYDYGNRVTYYYPKILGLLLDQALKIPKGNKVDADIQIPKEIFNILNSQMKRKFIVAFYECDGDSKQLRIIQAGKNLTEPPTILSQVKQMLQSFDFNSIAIKPSSVYSTTKTTRRRWVLSIIGREEKKKFKTLFSFKKLSQLNIGSRV